MKEFIVYLDVGDEVGESNIETIDNNYDNTSHGETVIESYQSESDVYVDIDECGNVFDLQGNVLYGDGVCEAAQEVVDSQVMDVYIHQQQVTSQQDINYDDSETLVESKIEVDDIPLIDTRCYVHWVAMGIALFFICCSLYCLRKRRG